MFIEPSDVFRMCGRGPRESGERKSLTWVQGKASVKGLGDSPEAETVLLMNTSILMFMKK